MTVLSRYRLPDVTAVFHENGGICNHLALMAPFRGFFMVFTLHLKERC